MANRAKRDSKEHRVFELLTVSDVCDRLKIGRTKAFELIGSGQLRPIRIGSSVRIDPRELERFIQDCATADQQEGSGVRAGMGRQA